MTPHQMTATHKRGWTIWQCRDCHRTFMTKGRGRDRRKVIVLDGDLTAAHEGILSTAVDVSLVDKKKATG